MFPGAFETSVYPPAVSESVARVWLNDPEIGFNGSLLTQINNPNFLIAQTPSQNLSALVQSSEQNIQTKIPPNKFAKRDVSNKQSNSFVASVETTSENPPKNGDTNQKTLTDSNEVFYEPRTGAKFQNRNGKVERLAEDGERIISEKIRTSSPLTSRARGTFFGGSANRVSN